MRPPMKPLKPLDEALAELLGHATPLTGVDTVTTFDADGRVLAQDCISALHVPPQDNSSMDGYAVRCADVAAAGALLPVSQRIAAGSAGEPLQPGTAARIFTGAPVPAGADAILMQEDCEAQGDGRVRINAVPQPGQWIRRAGEDITRGAVVLPAGTRLTPAELGLAASIGLHQLQVARRPRVALFSTGDELVMPGDVPPEQMRPGAIYNSNRFFLRAMLLRLGCEVTDFGIVPEQRARPDPDQRRCVGGRGRPHQARRSGAGHARFVADRHETRQAVCLRADSTRWGSSALHRPAGQPGVELSDLCVAGAALCAAAAGSLCCCSSNHSCPR